MEWDEEGVCYGRKDAKELVADVQRRCSREGGKVGSFAGNRSKLSSVDRVDSRYIKVGSIHYSAFGGLRKCTDLPM